ncbi:MAG TPA: SRPBCC domain-containing protein, partial [Pirellulales bacterium]
MVELLHQIDIQAPAARVYDAITSPDGLRSWWTDDCTAEPRVGSIAEFRFFGGKVVFRMRIEELIPARHIVWKCIAGPDEWPETHIAWDITEQGGTTRLRFEQSGWPHIEGHFRP